MASRNRRKKIRDAPTGFVPVDRLSIAVVHAKKSKYLRRGVPREVVDEWEKKALEGKDVIIVQNTTGTGPLWVVEKRSEASFAYEGGQTPETAGLPKKTRAENVLKALKEFGEKPDLYLIKQFAENNGIKLGRVNNAEQALKVLKKMAEGKK